MSTVALGPKDYIPAFYAGKSILITGATGFLGKVLIEKLLRSCPDVREIFLLMRSKKGMSIDSRLGKMLALPLFDKLREKKPENLGKLIPINGDVTCDGLGLQPVERRFLMERVSIIFHVAASVRFDDDLKDAIFTNTRSTRDICILAGGMKNLIALVHVSSTYTQADKKQVNEIAYPVDVDWKKTIRIAETVDNEVLKVLTPKFLGPFPNTYIFSKRLAEQIIIEYSKVLPCVIFRPSIVISTVSDPMPGWLDNFNGPVGMMVGGGKGILRAVYLDSKVISDFVPVDIAIKAMLITTWKRGLKTITSDPNVHVYNCSSADTKSISLTEIIGIAFHYNEQIPLEGIMWKPDTLILSNPVLYYMAVLVLHLLPALIVDGMLKLSGRKPILVKLHRKIYNANSALSYFTTHQWDFRNNKILDLWNSLSESNAKDFGFEYLNVDVHAYFKDCLVGAKVYLLKEDLSRVDQARKHWTRMWWIHQFFMVWLRMIVVWLLYQSGILTYAWESILDIV